MAVACLRLADLVQSTTSTTVGDDTEFNQIRLLILGILVKSN